MEELWAVAALSGLLLLVSLLSLDGPVLLLTDLSMSASSILESGRVVESNWIEVNVWSMEFDG